jgi:hypothetical protein
MEPQGNLVKIMIIMCLKNSDIIRIIKNHNGQGKNAKDTTMGNPQPSAKEIYLEIKNLLY